MDRPKLGSDVFEQIESEMHFQDQRFWKKLRAMQRPTSLAIKIESLTLDDGPPPPALPVKLSNIISEYGLALIEVEASKYPRPHPGRRRWMTHLTQRTEARVMDIIERLETRDPLLSLEHHGLSRSQMLEVLQTYSTWAIDMYAFESKIKEEKQPESVPVTEKTATHEVTTFDTDPEVERRNALLNDYKVATGNPANQRLYQARNSGIHKPQFYKWLKGTLPSTSETALNFERFLREKRPPIARTKRS